MGCYLTGSMTPEGHLNLIQNQDLGTVAHEVFSQCQRRFVGTFSRFCTLTFNRIPPHSLPLHSTDYQHFLSSLSVKSQINQPPPLISCLNPFTLSSVLHRATLDFHLFSLSTLPFISGLCDVATISLSVYLSFSPWLIHFFIFISFFNLVHVCCVNAMSLSAKKEEEKLQVGAAEGHPGHPTPSARYLLHV